MNCTEMVTQNTRTHLLEDPEESIDLSVIIPVYNEEENIGIMLTELVAAVKRIGKSWELIFVDDGSTDQGLAIIQDACKHDGRIKLIQLRRNFGQTAAISAGFDHAKGKVVVPMDGDLQNDPNDIAALLEQLDKGYDVVSGWRRNRKDKLFMRKLPSLIANSLISFVTGVHLHDYGCTLKAYRREVLEEVRLYGEMHRFIPAIPSSAGARIFEMPVNHRARRYGSTKYGLWRTVKVLFDLLTVKFLGSFFTKPLYAMGGMGLIVMLFGILIGAVVLFQKYFLGVWVHRNPLILLAVMCLIVSIQFIALGLLAELLTRTYYESQKKCIYVVRKKVNFTANDGSHNEHLKNNNL